MKRERGRASENDVRHHLILPSLMKILHSVTKNQFVAPTFAVQVEILCFIRKPEEGGEECKGSKRGKFPPFLNENKMLCREVEKGSEKRREVHKDQNTMAKSNFSQFSDYSVSREHNSALS